MSIRLNTSKRILMLFLAFWITFVSVFSAYEETVYSAEYVAGIVTATASGPLLTALLVGGAVVAGGIAVYKLATTTPEDYRDFKNGLKTGFQEFVADREKQIALEEDASLTDQEASDLGVQNAREHVNNFWDKAVDTTRRSVSGIKQKTMQYWKEFNAEISDVADNGIEENNDITSTTIIKPNAQNFTGSVIEGLNIVPEDNVGANCREIGGSWYIYKGGWVSGEVNFAYNDTIYPFVEIRVRLNDQNQITGSSAYLMYYQNGQIYQYAVQNSFGTTNQDIQNNIERFGINLKTFILKMNDTLNINNFHNDMIQHYGVLLAVAGAGASVPIWKRSINTALNNSKYGQALKEGRRNKIQNGESVSPTFKENSTPVRKSGIQTHDGVVNGEVGYDIPSDATWDGAIDADPSGYRKVVNGTGVLSVPDSAITGTADRDTRVEFPEDTIVEDTVADDPADPDNNEPTEEKPAKDVIDSQGGDFYPTALDLTNIFPFCIPFDIIYLVNEFNVSSGEAPTVTIPIVYPEALQGVLGESYEVVIDFNDFIAVRNVLRAFLLLLFIIGLMQVTRGLIRG